MTTTQREDRIAELEQRLATPRTYPTEVYTRIVGYYRSLANWNAGKREEYRHRKTFAENAERVAVYQDRVQNQKATTYLAFVQDSCPRCPAMKSLLPSLPFRGTTHNVGAEEGFDAAQTWEVAVTPTVIFLDANGTEIDRLTDASEWNRVAALL